MATGRPPLSSPVIGLGTVPLCGPNAWGPPRDRGAAIAVLRRAAELGVPLVDTADAYGPGVAEELIARALHPYDGVVIATKVGQTRPDGGWAPDGRPASLRAAAEGSLRRLRVEQIPLLLLHRPDPAVPITESVGALAELQRAGKAAHIGVCNVTAEQVEHAASVAALVAVQNRYNVADRSAQDVVDAAARIGAQFIAWGPALGCESVPEVAAVAHELDVTSRQVALAWLLARGVTAIPGTTSVAHLEENMAATQLALPASVVDRLARAEG